MWATARGCGSDQGNGCRRASIYCRRPAGCRLELAELVERVDALPAHLALAVRAVYLDDQTIIDAAEALGVPYKTLHYGVAKGLKLLRQTAA